MYHLQAGELVDGQQIVSGGLQQFLIRNAMKGVNSQEICEQPIKGRGSDHTTFHDLPEPVQLEIFSYLGAKDLCRVSRTCRYWHDLGLDDILWKRRLECDVKHWNTIGHSTNPEMYKECQSDWTFKEIYLRCSPEVNELVRDTNLHFHQLSAVLRSFWPKKTPKLAMFGPGLETSTRRIVRKILEDNSGMFKTTGMFPGQFEGVGSGFTMKMNDAVNFNLITLYTATKEERENRNQEERLRGNRLLAQAGDGDAEAEEAPEEKYEVRQSVKDLCRTLDGFIFVVDSEIGDSNYNLVNVSSGIPELFAMVNDAWAPTNIPVVILSCVTEESKTRISCIDVVSQLKLHKLNRPWQVFDCVVDDMGGVPQGIEWLVKTSQRR